MEHFVLVPASVFNKSLNTQSGEKQELPKYQLWQNPIYWTDSLEKKINRKLFAKADNLLHKILSFPRIRLSNLQTLFSDCVEIEILL